MFHVIQIFLKFSFQNTSKKLSLSQFGVNVD